MYVNQKIYIIAAEEVASHSQVSQTQNHWYSPSYCGLAQDNQCPTVPVRRECPQTHQNPSPEEDRPRF